MTREYRRCCGLGGRALKDLGGCVGVGYFRGRRRMEQFATTVDGIQDREQHCRACMHRERTWGIGHGERAWGAG